MLVKAVIGGVAGGIVGALIWALISYYTGYEIGYIAWLVGILVGAGARVLKAEGMQAGVACAVIALLSILAGKMLAVRMAVPKEIREVALQLYSPDVYNERVTDSEGFAKLENEDQHRQYMVDHKFTEAASAQEVPDVELSDFREFTVPDLKSFHEAQPSFEEWKSAGVNDFVDAGLNTLTLDRMFGYVKDDLGLIDAVFGILGIATAFKIAAGSDVLGDSA